MRKHLWFFLVLFLLSIKVVEAANFGVSIGEYKGVTAFSNGVSHGVNGDYEEYGYQYQCVEYVNRFYAQALNWKNMRGSGNGKDYFNKADKNGLLAFKNGGTEKPQPDDLLTFGGEPYGHVAIISEVGHDYIKIIEQNWSSDNCCRKLKMKVNKNEYYLDSGVNEHYIQGWLRIPGHTNTTTNTKTISSNNYISNPITYSLDHLGWLDVFKDGDPATNKIAAGSFDGGKRSGLHTTADTNDGHVYYHEVWWDNNERGNGDILDRLYKLDPLGSRDKKILTMTTGKFGGEENDILALTFKGDDKVYFYHNNRNSNQELGFLDPHPDSQEINTLATGDIDKDGRDELILSVPSDDHVYIFDNWNGKTFTNKLGFLNAHDNNPAISALAAMDIDGNGNDELLVTTTADDHIYVYYFDKSKLNKWWQPWDKSLAQPFVKQGYMDAHSDGNPGITHIAVGKFQGSTDHLAVTTSSDDYIYFYWGRNLNNAWGGIFSEKQSKNAFSWTEKSIISDLAAGDFDDSGDDELAVATYGDDHINFFGHGDGKGYVGYGGGSSYYQAQYLSQSFSSIALRPGEEKEVWVEYQNIGAAAWFAKCKNKISLRLDPQNRNSIFYTSSWQQENIPAVLEKTEVLTGDKIKFKFKIRAPKYSGKYTETFVLYLNNDKLKSTNFILNIVVDGEKPGKISNLRADLKESNWQGVYTNDATPAFLWDPATDRLSGIAGYYIAIDDYTPDGGWGNDWWIGNSISWTAPEKIKDGWHTVAVTAKDQLGNLNPNNSNKVGDAPYLKFMVDTKLPTTPADIGPSLKSAWDENISLARRPYFTWENSKDQGSGVLKYLISVQNLSGTEVSQFEISASNFTKAKNIWQVPVDLTDGNYQLIVQAQDKVGNLSSAAKYAFAVDSDRSVAQLMSLEIDKNLLLANGLEQAIMTATLYNPDGLTGAELSGKEIKFTISDDNGIATDTGSIGMVMDNHDGTYSVIYTAATKVGDGQITIAAQCVSCQPVYQNEVDIFLEPGGSFGAVTLSALPAQIDADGISTAVITSEIITDQNGNTIADGELFTVSVDLGAVTSADLDAETGGIQVESQAGKISFEIRSENWNGYGTATIDAQVKASNQDGTAAGVTGIGFKDVEAPLKPIILTPLNNSISNNPKPTISGQAEKNAQVLIYKKQNAGAWTYHSQTAANVSGNFSYTFGSSLADSGWQFRVTAQDAAGNISADSAAVSIIIDTVKPTISNNLPVGTIYHRTETASADYQDNTGGSGIDISSAVLKINGSTKLADVTNSRISFTNTFPESNQTYNVYVEVADRAGNVQSKSWTFNIRLFSYFLSSVGSGYKASLVPNWPNSNGIVPTPSWWEPSFNDASWSSNIYPADLPPSIIAKADPAAEWIWADNQVDGNETSLIRYRFNIPANVVIDDAAIRMSAENEAWGYVGYLNGNYFGKVPEQISNGNPYTYGIQSLINTGQNLLAIQVSNDNDNRAGLSYSMTVKYHD